MKAGFLKEEKAQVSFEYLLTVLFSVMLAITAAVLALNVSGIATAAREKIVFYREQTITGFMSN